jgi:imidazolonepropionase-like amidohydrolase
MIYFSRCLLVFCSLSILFSFSTAGQSSREDLSGLTLLFRNATVIDGSGRPPLLNTDVRVREGRIVAIGRRLEVPARTEVINAEGKFIVPGLIDTHVHLDAPMAFQLSLQEKEEIIRHTPRAFLYNGVTTVLNLSAPRSGSQTSSAEPDWIWNQRDFQRGGRLTAPRIFATGSAFLPEGGFGTGRHSQGLSSAEEARRQALRSAKKGADGFTLVLEKGLGGSDDYTPLPDDMLEVIVAVATSKDIPLFVHAMNSDEYHRSLSLSPRAIVHGLEDRIPEHDTILQRLASKKVAVIPTLSLFHSFLFSDAGPQLDDPVLQRSVPAFLLEKMRRQDFMEAERELFRKVARIPVYEWVEQALPVFRENVKKMHQAGVRLAVGSDGGGPVGYNFQGFNTPWELELLVESGLTPLEAIVAATRNGAEVIGIADRVGTIEKGKWADLLILRKDPLKDIRNIRSIERVVLNGRVYDRREFSYRSR